MIYESLEIDGTTIIQRLNPNGDISWIPMDESNSDYQRYLRWLNGEDESETLS